MLKIGLNGASGRMGLEIISAINQSDSEYGIAFAKTFKPYPELQANITELPKDDNVDVVIDFSAPEACFEILDWCVINRKPLVIGTTGFNDQEIERIKSAAEHIPILLSPNMSLSVNILFGVSKLVAAYLPSADVEIIESHHRHKKDAPSGTALKIGMSIADGRGVDFNKVACFNRPRIADKSRSSDEIGFAVIRGGDIVGKHTASFILDGEELSLTSEITNRKSFALGSLHAAKFLFNQKHGYFSMFDALGIKL